MGARAARRDSGLRALALAAALAVGAVPGPAALAQGFSRGEDAAPDAVRSLILTVDTDAVLGASDFGRRLEARINEAAEDLVAENSRIEAELAAEEQALTEERPDLPPDEFRAKADAFDEKVQRIRAEQDAKAREVQAMRAEGEREFLEAVTPILAAIAEDRGAVLIFERQQVLLSAEVVDVTGEAVRRLNAALGEGGAEEEDGAGEPEPEPEPAEPEPQADE